MNAPKSAEELYNLLKVNAKEKGYIFNKDENFVKELMDGLFTNLKRYGYSSCPCRMSSGNYERDKDIICPCIYMEDDVNKYGSCYCALYVSGDVYDGKRMAAAIPESRPAKKIFLCSGENGQKMARETVWRCCVCGYEHRGSNPPDKCPKCGSATFTEEYRDCPVDHGSCEVVWECDECGYEHKNVNPPGKCPQCGAAVNKFEKVTVLT